MQVKKLSTEVIVLPGKTMTWWGVNRMQLNHL